MMNIIDTEFNALMNFIKERTLDEIKEAIKQNLSYFRNKDFPNYKAITDYYNKAKLWGTIDLDKNDFVLVDNNAKALVNHRNEIEWLYNKLGDYKSKTILVNVLYYWLMLDINKIAQLGDKTFVQYFDLDLIHCNENEVFVDIGAYIGDTLISYINTFGKSNYKKIYCYEIVPANIKMIKESIEKNELKNVIVKEKGASDKKDFLFVDDELSSISQLSDNGQIKVETIPVDDDIEEKVSFIKMDIEGSEETALLGCLKQIKDNHPKLALSIYHTNEHLWKLARIIDEVDPTYKFYIRYYGGPLLPTEYILYAI